MILKRGEKLNGRREMHSNQPPSAWLVDSSVILRAVLDKSAAALNWFAEQDSKNVTLTCSKMAEVEVWRTARRRGADFKEIGEQLDKLVAISITDEIAEDAMALTPSLSGADSIHVATALVVRVGVATHDAEMAIGAKALGLKVVDPITDDPNRLPVA
jgi:predicted nucleic acid-binding protein